MRLPLQAATLALQPRLVHPPLLCAPSCRQLICSAVTAAIVCRPRPKVVLALTSRGHTHTPYRESKLTRILQDSLGGVRLSAYLHACIH